MVTDEEYFGSGTFQDFMNEEQEIKRALKMIRKQYLHEDDETKARMKETMDVMQERLERVQLAQEWLKIL